jgi:hypothetical protein
MDLRCDGGKKHGVLIDSGVLEVKCISPHCGAVKGVVVLHRFDTMTGELLSTKRYKDPGRSSANAADNAPVAVRFT